MTEKEFKPLALKTESDNFNYNDINGVATNTILAFFRMINDVDYVADTLKKALYYDPKDANDRNFKVKYCDIIDPYLDTRHSTDIITIVENNNLNNKDIQRLFHAALGKMTEAFEMLQALEAPMLYGKELDVVNFKEEIGDDQWYNSIIMDILQLDDFSNLRSAIISKLEARYPEKFTDKKAENRNLNKERKILEKNV